MPLLPFADFRARDSPNGEHVLSRTLPDDSLVREFRLHRYGLGKLARIGPSGLQPIGQGGGCRLSDDCLWAIYGFVSGCDRRR
jgi:hypothetical protein